MDPTDIEDVFFCCFDLRISRILLAPEVGFAQPARLCWKFVFFLKFVTKGEVG